MTAQHLMKPPGGDRRRNDEIIKERLSARIPRNISFIKPDVEAEANKSPVKKKKKSNWEDSPRVQAVRQHKEECRKMAAMYRGDNEDK